MEEPKLRVVKYPKDTIYPYSVFREGIGGKTSAKYYGHFETRKEAEEHIKKLEEGANKMKCIYPDCEKEGTHKFKIAKDNIVSQSFRRKFNVKGDIVSVCGSNLGFCLNKEMREGHSELGGFFLKRLGGKYIEGRWIKDEK